MMISCLEDQAFLPHQLEASFAIIFAVGLFCLPEIHITIDKPVLLGLHSLLFVSITLISLSPHGSFLYLISVGLRLLVCCWCSYSWLFADSATSPDKYMKALFWILTDPLGLVVELAIFFHLDHPIFLVIWPVRRATITGSLLTISLYRRDESRRIIVQNWALLMAVLMVVQIIMNLDEEEHYVTLGTVLLLLFNHALGDNEVESNADKVFKNDFMIPFIILKLMRVLKKR